MLLQNVGCLQQRRHQAGRGRPLATGTTTATPATAPMGRRSPGQTLTPSTLAAGACPWSVCLSLWLLLRRMEDVGRQISVFGGGWGVGGLQSSSRKKNLSLLTVIQLGVHMRDIS